MRFLVCLASLALATEALAGSAPPYLDPSQFATQSQVTNAANAAAAAQTAATNAQSAIPVPSNVTPSSGTLNGAAGSSATYQRGDAAIPITVQRTSVTTDASGNWSVTWNKAFQSSTPYIGLTPQSASGGLAIVCNWVTRTSTTAAGKCWQLTTSRPALLNIDITLAPTATPASTMVSVIGAEPTQ